MAKIERNDPCPCGSGLKYKRCCMARDKAAQAERVAWERAAQNMRAALIGFAKDESFVKDLALGLGLFWQDRYTTRNIHLMSVDESLRFFDWFAHDYRLQCQEDPQRAGRRLIEVYRRELDDTLQEKEAAVLDGWIASPPGSAFLLQETDAAAGTVLLQDLLLPERTVRAHDMAAARHGEVGQILLARPLPERDELRLAGATAVLPAAELEALRDFVEHEWQVELAEHPTAQKVDWLRDRAFLLTHYALQWAEREGRPAVAIDDPQAQPVGGKPLQKLIRWQQERTQVR